MKDSVELERIRTKDLDLMHSTTGAPSHYATMCPPTTLLKVFFLLESELAWNRFKKIGDMEKTHEKSSDRF